MGTVWRARNMTLHIDVALKLVRREIAGSHEASQRLLNEARAAAQIEHASIVRIHDFGETGRDDPYIVMELLKGESLEDVMAREGTLDPIYVARVILPILSALSLVHPNDVVHRDLKPENIFLAEDGTGVITPKLLDFGVAKMRHDSVEIDTASAASTSQTDFRQRLATRLTQMGHLLGSPDYMSPEQIRAASAVDGRADIWAVAVTMYHAIAGRPPFRSPSVDHLLLAILSEDPSTIDGIDPALWSIIEKGVKKDREARWPSAQQMGEALARWLHARGVSDDITGRSIHAAWGVTPPLGSLPPPPAKRSAVPILLLVGALAIVGGAVGFLMLEEREADPYASSTAETVAPMPSDDAVTPPVAPSRTAPESPTSTMSAQPPPPRPALRPTPSTRHPPPRPAAPVPKAPAPKQTPKAGGTGMVIPDGVTF